MWYVIWLMKLVHTHAKSIIDGVFVGFRYQNPAVFMLLDWVKFFWMFKKTSLSFFILIKIFKLLLANQNISKTTLSFKENYKNVTIFLPASSMVPILVFSFNDPTTTTLFVRHCLLNTRVVVVNMDRIPNIFSFENIRK